MKIKPKKIRLKPIIVFRPMTREDFGLLAKWLDALQVKEWWKEPSTLEAIEKKYGPRIVGKSATKCFITLINNKPVGLVQAYWVGDYKDYAEAVNLDESVAIDWFIGEEGLIGKGLGPQIASAFVAKIIGRHYTEAKFVVASPSINNSRSISALQNTGFEKRQVIKVAGEQDPEQLMVLPL